MTRSRAVAMMASATIASRILGFVRVMVVAAVLGTTALGNTFQSTNSISNVLFDLLAAGALSAALVPQLVRAGSRSEKEFNDTVSSLLTLVLIALGLISIVGVFFAHEISQALFSRAPQASRADQIRTGTILLRFFIPQVALYGIGAVAIAALTAKKKFITTVLAPIGSSVVLMACIGIFSITHNSSSLKLSTGSTILLGVAGTGACFAFILIPAIVAIRSGVSLVPSLSFRKGLDVLSTSTWAIAIQAAAAITLGAAIFMGNNRDGAVIAYQLAFVFFLAPYAIISQSFSTVLLPDLSHSASTGDGKEEDDFSSLVSTMITWTYRPIAVVAGIAIALGEPMMRFVSEGRAQGGFEMVELSFIALMVGLLPYSLFQASSQVYFARGDVRRPALTVLASSIIVSVVSVVLTRSMSGVNLLFVMGMTHTITYVCASIVLLAGLKLRGYSVFPNMTTIFIVAGSSLYAVAGIMIENIVDVRGRLALVAYCIVYLAITLAVAFVCSPRARKAQFVSILRTRSLTPVKGA